MRKIINYKVTISFSDGEFSTKEVKAINEKNAFEMIISDFESNWVEKTDGAKTTFRNISSITKIEIVDEEENNRLNQQRSEDAINALSKMKF